MPARLLAAALLVIPSHQGQQQPVLRSTVELVLVDVQVTGRDGAPVPGLEAEQFEVMIDGKRRPVVNVDRVAFGESAAAVAEAAASVSSPVAEAARQGRVLIVGIDQSSIQVSSEPAAREAVTRLIALASPEDEIGLVGFPQPGFSIAPTRDRELIRAALRRIGGQLQIPQTRQNLSLADAVDFTARDLDAMKKIVRRWCNEDVVIDQSTGRTVMGLCGREIETAARDVAVTFEMQALRSIQGLQALVDAAREWPGRKVLVIVSAGFAATDRIGGRPDIRLEADLLGKRAAEANAVIYSLHLDVSFLTAFSAASAGRGLQAVFRDSSMFANGLERFTGNAGGTLIAVHAGPDPALRRLLHETSSYYMLAVEALPEHRDGTVHRIQVKVTQRGATVRARSSVFIPKAQ